uniref:Uncharacterized protein n=1 Tax=Romanomermis culicivorax TaxID=13658 RepID=A0A915KGH8_ROMCU
MTKFLLFLSAIFYVSYAIRTTTTASRRSSVDAAGCCTMTVYPEGKVWISTAAQPTPTDDRPPAVGAFRESTQIGSAKRKSAVRGSAQPIAQPVARSAASINYTLYDPYGIITKVWAYDVDQSGAILSHKKVFEADADTLKCPAGYTTDNPEHKEMTKGAHAQTLCLQQNGLAAQNLKPDKWYAICRERSCNTCHLDKMKNTKKFPEYVKVESAKIQNDKLVIQMSVLEAGMRYNVSVEVGAGRPALANATIPASQTTASIQVTNPPDTIYRLPMYVHATPWPKIDGVTCGVSSRRQLAIVPPIKKVGALSRE